MTAQSGGSGISKRGDSHASKPGIATPPFVPHMSVANWCEHCNAGDTLPISHVKERTAIEFSGYTACLPRLNRPVRTLERNRFTIFGEHRMIAGKTVTLNRRAARTVFERRDWRQEQNELFGRIATVPITITMTATTATPKIIRPDASPLLKRAPVPPFVKTAPRS